MHICCQTWRNVILKFHVSVEKTAKQPHLPLLPFSLIFPIPYILHSPKRGALRRTVHDTLVERHAALNGISSLKGSDLPEFYISSMKLFYSCNWRRSSSYVAQQRVHLKRNKQLNWNDLMLVLSVNKNLVVKMKQINVHVKSDHLRTGAYLLSRIYVRTLYRNLGLD